MGLRGTWAVRAATLIAAVLLSTFAGAADQAPSAAPTFTLPQRGGNTVALESLKGQVVMLNFWASWCGPCRGEMPLLDSMYKRYSKQGFTLLGINVEAQPADAEGMLKATPVTFPILFDKENKVSQMYNVNAMPSSVFIDRKGNVRAVHRGYKPGDENEYLNQIRNLLKE